MARAAAGHMMSRLGRLSFAAQSLKIGRMQRASTCLAAVGILIAVAGCGRVDSGATYFPEIIRDKAPNPVVADPAPDVRALLKSDLNAVFLAASAPTGVSFSPPKPLYAEWTTC